jgi:acetyl esterase/lipase
VSSSLLRLVAVLALAPWVVPGCTDDAQPPPTTLRPADSVDIAYGPDRGCPAVAGSDEPCGGSQELDVWRSEVPGPNPVMLWVHGGGGVAGDKTVEVPEDLEAFLDDGWDLVGVNYRLATDDGEHLFPTGLLDVKRAVRWVKANAAGQDWDAGRVAAIGHSLGGNLVQLLATTAGDPALEPADLPPELASQDSTIVAGISLGAVSNLDEFSRAGWLGASVERYLGCAPDRCGEVVRAASVAPHVTPAAAPLLAVHGALDPWGTPAQGEEVRRAYEAAGIGDRFVLVVIDDGPPDAQSHLPDLASRMDLVRSFLQRVGGPPGR